MTFYNFYQNRILYRLIEIRKTMIKLYLNNYLNYNHRIHHDQSNRCAHQFLLYFCSILITTLGKINVKRQQKITQFARRSILFSCIRMMTMVFVTYYNANQCVFVLIFASNFPHLTLFYAKGRHHITHHTTFYQQKGKCVLNIKPAVQLKVFLCIFLIQR